MKRIILCMMLLAASSPIYAQQAEDSLQEKIEMFQFLVDMGFKEIEIGFPAASQIEFDLYVQQS